jgi:hypothetical protein
VETLGNPDLSHARKRLLRQEQHRLPLRPEGGISIWISNHALSSLYRWAFNIPNKDVRDLFRLAARYPRPPSSDYSADMQGKWDERIWLTNRTHTIIPTEALYPNR